MIENGEVAVAVSVCKGFPSEQTTWSPPLVGAGTAEGCTAGVPLQSVHLQSIVGLVWRSVVLWMLLLALLTLANILG
jgi:hypothetical protein